MSERLRSMLFLIWLIGALILIGHLIGQISAE